MHIGATLRTTAKNCGLRTWIDGKNFPRDDWFESVDLARSILQRHTPDGADIIDPDWAALAPIIALIMDRDGLLLAHVAKKGKDTEDQAEWERICLAAAYVVLERYEAAVKEGRWPPTR